MSGWGGTAITQGIGAGTQLYTGKKSAQAQEQASNNAARLQAEGLDKQLAFERDLEARRRIEYDQQVAQERAQWDAEQARRAPFRQAADGAARLAAGKLGIAIDPRPAPTFTPSTPAPGQTQVPGTGSVAQAPAPRTLGTMGLLPPPPTRAPMTAPLDMRTLGTLPSWAAPSTTRY